LGGPAVWAEKGGGIVLTDSRVYAVLPSKDLAASRAWYEAKTGTTPTKEDPGGLWYECADGTWFVVTASQFAGTAQNTAASFHVDDLQRVMSDYRSRGLVFEEYDMPGFKTVDGVLSMGPYKAAWFKDGDGNTIEMSQVGE
jgi:catechol 2,3-dioxygenase-like lactoylglutathione lyase family enzyme